MRVISGNRYVDPEAQSFPTDTDQRMLFCGLQLIVENFRSGMSFRDMPQTVVIMLLEGETRFPESEQYITTGSWVWDTSDPLLDDEGGIAYDNSEPGLKGSLRPTSATERMVFVIVELDKIRARYNELTEEVLSSDLLSWAYLLTEAYKDDEEVAAMIEKFPEFEKFAQMYGHAIDDPGLQAAYDRLDPDWKGCMPYLEDLRTENMQKGLQEGIEEGRAQGIEQGIEEGREQERQALAEKLKAAGMSQEFIDMVLDGD